jgi:hypothetical protein
MIQPLEEKVVGESEEISASQCESKSSTKGNNDDKSRNRAIHITSNVTTSPMPEPPLNLGLERQTPMKGGVPVSGTVPCSPQEADNATPTFKRRKLKGEVESPCVSPLIGSPQYKIPYIHSRYSQPPELHETQATQENLAIDEGEGEGEDDYEEEVVRDAEGNIVEVRKVKRSVWGKLISFQNGEKPVSKR